MTGSWDANLKLVYVNDLSGSVAVDTVRNGDPFEVVAEIRIGQSLMQVAGSCDLFVSVRNLSRSSVLSRQRLSYALAPQDAPLHQRLEATFDAGWKADDGDVLEVIATFKVTAGVHQSYSLASGTPFIVCS
jgi:hypothetical protein